MTTYDNTTDDYSDVDITLDDLVQPERPFPGVITVDIRETGQYGEQIHLEVKSIREDGTSATFPTWMPIYFKDGKPVTYGALARVGSAIKKVFFPSKKNIAMGKGELVGLAGMWVLRNHEYKDKRKEVDGLPNPLYGTMVTQKRPDLVVLRSLTKEEAEALGLGGVSLGAANAVEDDAPTWTDDDAQVFLTVMEGKTSVEFQKGLGNNKAVSQEQRRAILGGDAAKFLVKNGYATQENGVVTRVKVEVAA